jgi:hypothetical protein
MAITDWASLLANVQSYTVRTDTAFTNQVETFVANAEQRIFEGVGTNLDPLFSEPLRSDVMSSTTTITMTDGEGSIASDSLGLRSLNRTSDRIGLDYLAPDAFAKRFAEADTGNPRWYTIEGNTIKTSPGGFDGTLNVTYWARPDGISSSSTTNVVLTAHPTVYLYATLLEAYTWIGNLEKTQTYLALTRSTVSGINATVNDNRYGGGKMVAKARRVIGE